MEKIHSTVYLPIYIIFSALLHNNNLLWLAILQFLSTEFCSLVTTQQYRLCMKKYQKLYPNKVKKASDHAFTMSTVLSCIDAK